MLYKRITPCASDFGGLSPVLILKISSKGLDKTASMKKRAGAFLKLLKELKPLLKKAYLHVITTGGYLTYGANRNLDGWIEKEHDYYPPMMKGACIHLDGGLLKYHDLSYMRPDKAAVYQLHDVSDDKKCGIIKAACYNKEMHRGELIILVDLDKWAARLHKKANGQDIYLSVGASMDHDYCSYCGHKAQTFLQHCDHIKKKAGWVGLDGTKVCMLNDSPHFYDISGVNVPADQMAFVLKKVASGTPVNTAINNTYLNYQTRPSMSLSKAASILDKLAKMEKLIICKIDDDPIFYDDEDDVRAFLSSVENYDALEIIDQCHRKAILLSPLMLFKLIGKLALNRDMFNMFAENCSCNCKNLMLDMQQDPMFSMELQDGSFDSKFPLDLNLASILDKFITSFGVSRPALNGKTIRISISVGNTSDKSKSFLKLLETEKNDEGLKEDIKKKASDLQLHFRRTYARYVLSFALRNSLDTCYLAMQKLARYR